MRRLTPQDQATWEAYTQQVQPLKHNNSLPCNPPSTKVQVTPRLPYSAVMDLHGASLASAHEAALAHVDQSKFHHKHVMIITGKSGPMSSHMPRWLDHLPHVKQVDTLPGGGAFRVWLRKPKK